MVTGFLLGIISVYQLNRNLTPFPKPKSNAELVTKGLYKHIRHPIYTGILLFLFGFALFNESLYRIIITAILLLLFYFKSKYEEQQLTVKYSDYPSYKKTTGRFLPKL